MQSQESLFLAAANICDNPKYTAVAGKHPTYFSFEHEAVLIRWMQSQEALFLAAANIYKFMHSLAAFYDFMKHDGRSHLTK